MRMGWGGGGVLEQAHNRRGILEYGIFLTTLISDGRPCPLCIIFGRYVFIYKGTEIC
jgi:hypothetical protein